MHPALPKDTDGLNGVALPAPTSQGAGTEEVRPTKILSQERRRLQNADCVHVVFHGPKGRNDHVVPQIRREYHRI